MVERSLYPRMGIAVLALVGLIDAIYLLLSRYQNSIMACPVTGNGCATVRDSGWSIFPPPFVSSIGVPVALLGVIGYVLLLGLALASLHTDKLAGLALPLAQMVLGTFAVGFAFYLFNVQTFAIGAFCFWCLLSGILVLLIWVLGMTDWYRYRHGSVSGVALPPTDMARRAH